MTTSTDDDGSWQETRYLLRSPTNARRLMEAVARDREAATVAARADGVHDPAPAGEERGRA
ncbi:hypothetical protein [Streptomyces sp. NPDC101206]|uniref:hypothetical protein n=1 Tax=Streptomyces sp. NPDC101206 TaxID=3366128 RepID=UPI003813552A